MTDAEFEALVAKGLDDLHPDILARMKNVAIIVRDRPTPEQLASHDMHDSWGLFGLYEGVPLTERGSDVPILPDTITIFKEAILAEYDTAADITACVSNTVWHEVAHHFGYDDEWIEREEIRRGKTA
jgi:predicted Zn-dependent protease with MMP-like domain